MAARSIQRAFGAGELSPYMLGRADDAGYQMGLALCRNFIVLPQGPAQNRPGLRFVRAVKDLAQAVRLIPFTFSTDQSMVLELGAGYVRFHTGAATLMYGTAADYAAGTAYAIGDLVASSGTTYYCIAATTGNAPPNAAYWYALPATGEYEIPMPYAAADLFGVRYVQSMDVLTLVHTGYPPKELRRLGATKWVLTSISFASTLTPPATPTVVAQNCTATRYTNVYCVTATSDEGLNESSPSAEKSVASNLFEIGCTNKITWGSVTGATGYRVYKQHGGIFGYIGATLAGTLTLIDDNITPDMTMTPPIYDGVIGSGAGSYPGAVSYYEQRRCFAGAATYPQQIWMTKSGTESNMSYSLPVRDDDRISFRVAAREANAIRHIVPLSQLLILTSAAEWRVTSINSDALTPATISVRPQSYVGASDVQPAIVGNTLIYCAARGGHVRECAYSSDADGFLSGDLSLRAGHLFDGMSILEMAYAKAPHPVLWFVSSGGKLLGLTYIPEQKVGAWHQHETAGVFEACCVVPESTQDALYCVVRRTVNGSTVRYIERLDPREDASLADCFYVDAGLTYDGAPADTISGLDHLEGCRVAILADGAVHPQRTVAGGAVRLDREASTVQVGLPYAATLSTLPIATDPFGGPGSGRPKAVNKVTLRMVASSGVWAGPDASRLTEAKLRTNEPYGTPPALRTGEVDILLSATWAQDGGVTVQQQDPLPLTLVSLAAEVEMGGAV